MQEQIYRVIISVSSKPVLPTFDLTQVCGPNNHAQVTCVEALEKRNSL